jgi:hypothetical protein
MSECPLLYIYIHVPSGESLICYPASNKYICTMYQYLKFIICLLSSFRHILDTAPHQISTRGVVFVNVWQLDLQLSLKTMPITTKVVSSNRVHGEVYSIQHYVIKFVSDLREVGGFLRVLREPGSSTNIYNSPEVDR